MPAPPRVPFVHGKRHGLKCCQSVLTDIFVALMVSGGVPIVGKPFTKQGVQMPNPRALMGRDLEEKTFQPTLNAMAGRQVIVLVPIAGLAS